ncbi:hypothetical protein ACNKHX_15190 [Shigella flexneri]
MYGIVSEAVAKRLWLLEWTAMSCWERLCSGAHSSGAVRHFLAGSIPVSGGIESLAAPLCKLYRLVMLVVPPLGL